MNPAKTCQVYFRPEAIYVFGFVRTPHGSIARIPAVKLPRDGPPQTLGESVLTTLRGLPDGETAVDLSLAGAEYRAHLSSLGFRTINAFEKSAKTVAVEMTGDSLKVVPYERARGGGFLPLNANAMPSEAEAGVLGHVVLQQLAVCA